MGGIGYPGAIAGAPDDIDRDSRVGRAVGAAPTGIRCTVGTPEGGPCTVGTGAEAACSDAGVGTRGSNPDIALTGDMKSGCGGRGPSVERGDGPVPTPGAAGSIVIAVASLAIGAAGGGTPPVST